MSHDADALTPLENVGQYSIGIAHDFNNLLSIIMAHGRVLLDAHGDESQAPRELHAIMTAAQQGAAMVRRLISFARQEPMEQDVVSLHELMEGLPDRMRAHLHAAHHLKAACEGGALLVRADAGALEEVLQNLVMNARDAMPLGGTLRIAVRRAVREGGLDACGEPIAPGEYVTITVRDTGAGLDEVTRRRMFEPFFTTKPFGKGAGLGLPMCQTLVRQMGGFLEVASTPQVGTTVLVSLPAVTRREFGMASDESEDVVHA